jgi:molybdenum cofactor guanylyltransferase
MGRDKTRLRLGGRTLLTHVQQAANQAGLPVRVIRKDLVPRCGPLGGVYTALRTTEAGAVLFLSCDMPFVTGKVLAKLVAKLKPRTKAVFLDHGSIGFPFAIRRAALKGIEELMAAGEFSMRSLAKRLKARPLRLRKGQGLAAFNINTPEDFIAAQEMWRTLHTPSRS